MDSDFFSTYSITACRIDCETRYLVENCNCRMVHMPGRAISMNVLIKMLQCLVISNRDKDNCQLHKQAADVFLLRWIGTLPYFHSVSVQWLQLAFAVYLLHLFPVRHLRRRMKRSWFTEETLGIWKRSLTSLFNQGHFQRENIYPCNNQD